MNTYTNIRTRPAPFQSGPSEDRLRAAAPNQYANPAVQAQFNDIYRAAGQKAAVDMSRANTMAAADYTSKANAVQNQAALGGLSQLAKQQQNAMQRDLAMQDMQNNWMRQMQGGLLGGLL